MRIDSSGVAAIAIGALMALAPSASAAAPAATVNAEGNVFTGGLQFDPASVSVHVGDTVRWVNTDRIVPHTATEDHGLWDLSGSYGATPANPPGFGPGETRDRVFEAGTEHYYCKVHPQQMHGVVAVPVELSAGPLLPAAKAAAATPGAHRRRHRVGHHHRVRVPLVRGSYRTVTAIWASAPPAQGLVFDVQRRLGGGDWQEWQTGTITVLGTFRAGQGETWSVRARLRRASDPSAATDWSPPASVTG